VVPDLRPGDEDEGQSRRAPSPSPMRRPGRQCGWGGRDLGKGAQPAEECGPGTLLRAASRPSPSMSDEDTIIRAHKKKSSKL
jgi:hypothetical protein